MSAETILTRMMNEPEFAEAVFVNAEKALAEYNLASEDLAKFKNLTRAHYDALIARPEERKSFGILVDDRTGGRNHNQTNI